MATPTRAGAAAAASDRGGAARAVIAAAAPRPFPAIAVGGAVVGALDLAYAILMYSPHAPAVIPQAIASGLLGAKAFSGGAGTAALGVALHFLISFTAAAVYYLCSRRLRFMTERAVLCGMIFGALVYAFMHAVVLPLSAVPPGHMPVIQQVYEFVEHLFCVGLPIALSVRHYSH